MTRFFLLLALIGCGLVLAALGAIQLGLLDELPTFFFQTFIFLLFGTSLLFVYLFKFNKPDFFVHLYLLSIMVKLIAYGAYNFIMIMDDKSGAAQNVVWFVILYFIFTALEIGFLYRKITKL